MKIRFRQLLSKSCSLALLNLAAAPDVEAVSLPASTKGPLQGPACLPTRPVANADDYLGGLHVGETRKQAQFVPIERVNNKHELCQRGVIASTASAVSDALAVGESTR